MENKIFNLDLSEKNKLSRILRMAFGIICIIVALLFIIILKPDQFTNTTWITIAFLAIFGSWQVLYGLGLTDRYIEFPGDSIILKHSIFSPRRVIHPSDLKKIGFSQLTVSFFLTNGKTIILRLGTYYRDNSLKLMEEVERFCITYNITTAGIDVHKDKNQS